MNLLCSPHDDDSVLFAAVTCMRAKPLIVVCTDSYVQDNRGEVGCSAAERAEESARAHAILDCDVHRMGIRDDNCDEESIIRGLDSMLALLRMQNNIEVRDIDAVYAPAIQGGNIHHDQTASAALKVFGRKVKQYTTYTKTELYTEGTFEIVPTKEERLLKKQALEAYQSQLRINGPHFQAVINESEWLTGGQRLHLGCGKDIREGWINLDRSLGADVVCDVTKERLPFDDSSMDRVYSQDFLEHLPPEARVPVMNEIWRVLKPGGMMEHFIPNAGSRNDYGSPSHLSHWNLQLFEHFDIDSYRWEKDRQYEGFIGGFKKVLAELVNYQTEDDGIKRAQSIHVKYSAVKG